MFEPAGFSGPQHRGHDDDLSLGAGGRGGQMPAHPLIDAAAKADH